MKLWIGIMVLAVFCGCQSRQDQSPVVAQVGSYQITMEEFEDAYKNSAFFHQDSLANRKAFLDNMINQKLVLLDAQRRGLDRDPRFLQMVQNFWQQSLLTVALQQKSKEGSDLDAWMDYLRKNTKIDINQEYLK